MTDDVTMKRLLEADIAELEGQGDSDVARLVREDAAARAIARSMLATMREVDAAIAHIAASRPESPAGARADAWAAFAHGSNATTKPRQQSSPSGMQDSARLRRRTTTGRRTRPLLATLGVAAAAMALLVIAETEPAAPPAATAADAEPMTASLNVSSSRPFAVFPTDNPDIAIVWLFDEEER
jgi:hypothetical protein